MHRNKKIEKVLKQISDEPLRKLTLSIIEKHYDAFVTQPAGCGVHHSRKGGLLVHSANTALLAAAMTDRYPDVNPRLNRSLIVTGAFLHDIGKVKCYKLENEKYVSTKLSLLHHHIPIGYHIVATQLDKMISLNQISEEVGNHLLHMIVSHHGRVEYRSPRAPKTSEAFIVSQADLLDAYMGSPKERRERFNK